MSLTLQRPRLSWPLLLGVVGAILVAIAAVGVFIALLPSGPPRHFVEYEVMGGAKMPTAVAAGPDGSVWFSIDLSDVIGRLRDGRIEFLPTGIKSIEPVGLAVAPDGSAWFTDNAAHSISRVAVSGEVTRIPLDTPSVRLGRLAVGGNGAVWFAEETGYSVSEIRDGKLIRHYYDSPRGGPLRRRGRAGRHRVGEPAIGRPDPPHRHRRRDQSLRSAERRLGSFGCRDRSRQRGLVP